MTRALVPSFVVLAGSLLDGRVLAALDLGRLP